MARTDNYLYHLIRSVRPRQWLKNLAIAAPLVFAGRLFITKDFFITIQAILIFCVISSSIYLFNDVVDYESDRKHPIKKNRPIASGKISINQALTFSIVLLVIGLFSAYQISPKTNSEQLAIQPYFLYATLSYVILQIFYSFYLKHIAIIDVFCIAAGFILRIYAGGFVINTGMSIWLLICIISTSLLIAVGKRRAEMAIMADRGVAPRIVLSKYPPEVLNSYVAMFSNAAFLSWALYSFFAPPVSINQQFPEIYSLLPKTLAQHNKLLMSTIPVVLYGIMRYLKIIFDGSKAESPERILLTDKPLLLTAVTWAFMIVVILDVLPGSLGD